MIVELFMLLISGSAHSDYEVPQITPKPREYSDKPKLIRSLKRQCCLQVFLSLIATLAVVISSLLLFVEGTEIYEWTMINESMIIYLLQINVVLVSDSLTPPAAWSPWSECTRICGGGFQLRSRQCPPSRTFLGIIRKHSCRYTGETAEIRSCNVETCTKFHLLRDGKNIDIGEDDEDGEGSGWLMTVLLSHNIKRKF